jgi:hypothetical protein
MWFLGLLLVQLKLCNLSALLLVLGFTVHPCCHVGGWVLHARIIDYRDGVLITCFSCLSNFVMSFYFARD